MSRQAVGDRLTAPADAAVFGVPREAVWAIDIGIGAGSSSPACIDIDYDNRARPLVTAAHATRTLT
ncbi:hypothetical protein [Burkholderia cenocepacia]|uniref:hypothetical protein n=1 Tax=Burkholderia cenocepacia TaxID=95486 RepID=UPI002AB0A89F|nr:hypothetical protein [Burkholderia cenocepacia]